MREELLLYNIPSAFTPSLIAEFASITGKVLGPDSDLHTLSGGQKVVLMCLCAIHSPARNILFIDLWHSLDPANRDRISKLLSSHQDGRRISHAEVQDASH